jgi:hypothetical protein
MPKCWYCQASKGKRYCSPIDCAKNRLINIECNEDCKYLEGVAFQKGREEEKELSKLIESVPHGQYDDIFQNTDVASMAFEIETFIRSVYIDGRIRITDKLVFESYKKIYQNYFKDEKIEEDKLDVLTDSLLHLFESNIGMWEKNMDKAKISQVILRLMLSVKNMSGGGLGEFGYLNYLKNNLLANNFGDDLIIEDKFGNKTTRGSRKIN